MSTIKSHDFRVKPGARVRLEKWPTSVEPYYDSKEEYETLLAAHVDRLSDLRIVKIFLHLSRDEQRRRFLGRLDDPDKHWKFSLSDIQERAYWSLYTTAYEECLHATSTHHAPWFAVPADDKDNARLIVSRIVLDALGGLDMAYPRPHANRRRELAAARKELAQERT